MQYKLQLGENKFINSVNVDNTIKVGLSNNESYLKDDQVNGVVDASKLYDDERQDCTTYKIYGEIQYLSQLEGIHKEYTNFVDYFFKADRPEYRKTFLSDFKVFLVRKASTGNTIPSQTPNRFVNRFEVLTNENEVMLFNAGYSENIFESPNTSYVIKTDINLSGLTDQFGLFKFKI